MRNGAGQFDRFAARLYRRMVLLRIVEAAGVGILIGSIAALVIVPMQLYRSQPAMGLIALLLSLCGVTGMAWGIARRPGMVTALMAADRQAGLSDLLSTAWLVRQSDRQDEFSGAVLALAEAQVLQIRPASIAVHRLGRRAWSGIGLATALVLAMGLLANNPVETAVSAAQQPASSRLAAAPRSIERHPVRGGASASGSNSLTARPDLAGEDDRVLDTNPNVEVATGRDPSRSNGSANIADPRGAGAGYAASNSASSGDPFTIASVAPNRNANGQDPGASGSGGAAGSASAHPAPPPPWASSAWNSARDAATRAIRDGRIPADYRDLVRDYFQRD